MRRRNFTGWVERGRERKILFCPLFASLAHPPPPPPPSQKPLKNHQILWKTCVENDVCRNPQRGSFVWLEKVGSIVGGFSKDNGNGSKNARFFKVCRNYINWVKMSTDVLLIKPIAFLLLEVLVVFAVDVGVDKLSSQVCQYS